MSLEREVMLAMPPWKVEFMEKKRKKEKMEEIKVPLWKRELLKRIHSKNHQRMNEDQADILEEHIPKVSDNIFLVHEKQHHPHPRPTHTKSTDIPPLSPINITSVDNIVIIEKEKPASDDPTSNSNTDSIIRTDETKEYPKVGIVHKLLGRFQADKTDSHQKTKAYQIPAYQRSKSVETSPPAINHSEPHQTVIIEKEAQDLKSSDTHDNEKTLTMPTDLLSPLLISSAKPFSRQAMSTTDHGFHHVNVPIRKVSAPTSPKHVASPPKIEPVSPKPDAHKDTSSFSEDLSQLHSARESTTTVIPTPTVVIAESQEKQSSVISAKKRINLQNGETLHSSGSGTESLPNNAKTITTTKLQDKSNFTSYRQSAKTQPHDVVKPEKLPTKPKYEAQKKEIIDVHKKVATETKKTVEVQAKPSKMKENQSAAPSGFAPRAKRRDNNENKYKEVFHGAFDESTLKSEAAIVVNQLMASSKTFKITPKARTPPSPNESSNMKTSTVVKNSSMTNGSPATLPVQNHKPAPVKRSNVEKDYHIVANKTDSKPEVVKPSWVKEKPKNDLPSTSIDDILDKSDLVITPVTSLPLSPTEPKKETVVFKEEKKPSRPATIPQTVTKETPKPQNSFMNRTSTNTISIIPKSETAQKPVSFGPKFPKSTSGGRGKCFTIDPSKFRKTSSAQPPTATQSNAARESSNTRMIVPGQRSGVTETDSTETAKTGKRKLTVDQITVIGGYVSLERSCLIKDTKRKKSVSSISFCEEKDLEKTYTYVSERSMLAFETTVEIKTVTKSPGFGKDSTIGKYTPKYLLSMKSDELEDEDDSSESKSTSTSSEKDSQSTATNDATPDDNAGTWDDVTNSSSTTDILF